MAAQFCCGYATAAILPVLCYVFVHKFLFNPHFDLEPDYIIESQFDTEFNDVIYVGKYYQLFTHESIIDQYVLSLLKRIGQNAEKCQKPCQKQPLPLEARGLPSNT